MPSAFTPEDLLLLGYEDISPVKVNKSVLAYTGKAKAGIIQAQHTFAYIKTDADIGDIADASRKLRTFTPLYILRSKSGPNDNTLRRSFGADTRVFQIENLLWERVNDLFKSYAKNISLNVPAEPNFIAPRGKELSPKDRLDSYLLDYFRPATTSQDKKRLLILKANAGVGKTTLCRHLVKQFAQRISTLRVIPVYVEAAHWGSRVSYESGLWDIIQLSLQNFDPATGISQNLFEAALRRGFIIFIFDGFDELCSNPRSNVSATDVIESLQQWAEDSDARIILTTRTPYWDLEVGKNPDYAYSLNLLPFNPQQAKEYIRKFFEHDDARFQKARELYSNVIKHAGAPASPGGARAQFWSLPIAVSMICDAVKVGLSNESWRDYKIQSLLIAICDRETKRQRLGISGAAQFQIFQEIALLDASKVQNAFARDDLLAAGVPDADVGKLMTHPFVHPTENGSLVFAYDFFGPYLRAMAIADAIRRPSSIVRSSVMDAMRAEENGKGFQMEHVASLLEGQNSVREVEQFVRMIPRRESAVRSFLLHLLLRVLQEDPNVVTDAERAHVVLQALNDLSGDRVLRGTRFTGVFEHLDFQGVEFDGCTFVDVSFRGVNLANCTFRSCSFDGDIQFQFTRDEETFSLASLAGNCEFRGTARLALEPLLRRDPSERDELVKDLLESGLAKFWHNGKFKERVRKADWQKGALGRTRSSDELLDVFTRSKLIRSAATSGVQEGVWVFNRDAISDLQNFMDHRRLSGIVLSAFNDLLRALR